MPDTAQLVSSARFWPGGQDSWTEPDALDEFTFVNAMNVLCKGGRPRTRPGSRTLFCLPFGNLQGGTLFTPRSGIAHLVAAVDGLVYVSAMPFSGWRILPGIRFNPDSRFVTMTACLKAMTYDAEGVTTPEPEPYQVLVFQDGATRSAYWDGSVSRHMDPRPTRADELTRDDRDETPIGLHCAWSNNRLWVARGRVVFASDLGNPLKFKDRQYIAELPAFILPDTCTGIIETADASGILCFYASGADFIETSIQDRTQWANTPNIQRQALEVGCVAPRSLVTLHNTIFWFSPAGWVNLDAAAREYTSSQLIPIDTRMTASKVSIGPDLSGVCAGTFENLALVSVPFCSIDRNPHTWVLDVAVANDTTKHWAGYWTGWRPVQWASGEIGQQERLFCFSADADGANRVWEMMLPDMKDNECDITSSVQLRLDTFGTPAELKQFSHSVIELSGLRDSVTVIAAVAGSRGWFERIMTKEIEATWTRVFGDIVYGDGLDGFPRLAESHEQTRLIRTEELRTPRAGSCNECGVESRVQSNIDYGFSVVVAWSGVAALKSIVSYANEWPDDYRIGACEDVETGPRVKDATGCSSLALFPDTDGPFPKLDAVGTFSGPGLENDAALIEVQSCAFSQLSLIDAQRRADCRARYLYTRLALSDDLVGGTFALGCNTLTIALNPELAFFSEDGSVRLTLADIGAVLWGTSGFVTFRIVNVGQSILVITGFSFVSDEIVVISGPSQTSLGAGDFALVTLGLSEPDFVDL